jgi:ABC-type Fe3+-hydroxamate transport system substrate-binding protein
MADDVLLDDLGAQVAISHPLQRVVSLVPSLTEALAASARELLVGATDFCVRPPNLDEVVGHPVTRVRGPKNPDCARIEALRPDLVVVNQEENREFDVDHLRADGVPVWVTAIDSVDSAITSLGRLFGEALGMEQPDWLTRARDNWAQPDPTITASAVVCVWRDPWMVIGPNTYVADLLRRSGVELAHLPVDDWANARYPKVDLHALRASGADRVLLMDQPYAFSPTDGPEEFTGMDVRIMPERPLAWYGPGMTDAREEVRKLVF